MDEKSPEAIRTAMRSWRRRSEALDAERNPLIMSALAAGISKEDIHQSTGVSRSTIDRIAAREGGK